ncbi:uncharacterized protein VTP21DRAFT_7437 [Calcarisporiella thermophila]|uniref:uncharacterized protein n=1 Tax=Calcarisporiella thermophila TaxID=911321 RepID=UPI00374484EC
MTIREQIHTIFNEFDTQRRGRIVMRDFLPLVERYELKQNVIIFTDDLKDIIHSFATMNPELEVTVDDLVQVIVSLHEVSSASPAASAPINQDLPQESIFSERKRTAPIIHTGARTRRPSKPSNHYDESWEENIANTSMQSDNDNYFPSSPRSPNHSLEIHPTSPSYRPEMTTADPNVQDLSFEGIGASFEIFGDKKEGLEDDATDHLVEMNRIRSDMVRLAKEKERRMAIVVRHHEEKIGKLERKRDELKAELAAKKREVKEFKSKEKVNTQEISALENDISSLQDQIESQRENYFQLKALYEEKCDEAEKLQDILRQKEEELNNAESAIAGFASEQKRWTAEKQKMEQELYAMENEVQALEEYDKELQQQKEENSRLRHMIDQLQMDLKELTVSGRGMQGNTVKTLADEANIGVPDINDMETIVPPQDQEIHEIETTRDNSVPIAKENSDILNAHFADLRTHAQAERRSLHDEIQRLQREIHAKGGPIPKETVDIGVQCDDSSDISNLARRNLTDGDAGEVTIMSEPGSSHRDVSVQSSRSRAAFDAQYQMLARELDLQAALLQGLVETQGKESRRRLSTMGGSVELVKKGIQSLRLRRGRITASANTPDQKNNPTLRQQILSTPAKLRAPPLFIRMRQELVSNTTLFALYGLAAYLCGVVTSAYLIDANGGHSGMPGGAYGAFAYDGGPDRRAANVVLYWLETLLFNAGDISHLPT